MMKPKSMLRIGRLFLALGVFITLFLVYQSQSCPNDACRVLFLSLSLFIMVLASFVMIIAFLFGMRLFLRGKHGKG